MAANEPSETPTTKVVPETPEATTAKTTEPRQISTLDVNLLDGQKILSETEVSGNELEFRVRDRNDTAEPLNMATVKTALMPSEIKVEGPGVLAINLVQIQK